MTGLEDFEINLNMTQVTCETFQRVFTTVCYDITHYSCNDRNLVVDIPNVIIKQKPEEMAQIKFSISTNNMYGYNCQYGTGLAYEFNLIFKEELNSMMLCSYSYEIKCIISCLDLKTGIYNKNDILFFCEIERTSESIKSAGLINHDLKSKLKPDNKIKFIISRNLKNAQVNDHKHFLQADFFDQLFFLEQYGDVKVIVSGKVFNVHKDILSLRSEVFRAMFSHEMTENKEGLIKIENKPEVIEEMLRYIYTFETKNLDANMSIELYKVAHLYEINDLKDKCIEFIKFNLNSESFVSVLKFSLVYELKDLKKGVFNYIDTHEDEFVRRNDYQEFLNENLSVQSITHTLKLCAKYPDIFEKLKLKTLQFIKSHSKEVIKEKEYLDLFESHHQLIKEIYMFVHK